MKVYVLMQRYDHETTVEAVTVSKECARDWENRYDTICRWAEAFELDDSRIKARETLEFLDTIK